jgi:hypothetical protein
LSKNNRQPVSRRQKFMMSSKKFYFFSKIKLFFLTLLILFFSVFPGSVCKASPYGLETPGNTICDRLYVSDVVVYGKIVQKMRTKNQGELTEFEVFANIKGGRWGKGDFLFVNEVMKHPDKTVGVLFLERIITNNREVYKVDIFYPDKDKEIFEYTRQIMSYLSQDKYYDRLSYLFSKIKSQNELISQDAFGQLSQASFIDLRKEAPSIDRNSLRYLLGLAKIQANRRSFYAFLLGLAGNPGDIDIIVRIIENPANKNSEVIHGAMMAYGLLRSNHAGYFMEKMKQGPDNMRIAVLKAVKNLMINQRPANPHPVLETIYWAFENGSPDVAYQAVLVCRDTRIVGPVTQMRSLYTGKFRDFKAGRISVIEYLKFVRRSSPEAVRLLEDLKDVETDPEVRRRF